MTEKLLTGLLNLKRKDVGSLSYESLHEKTNIVYIYENKGTDQLHGNRKADRNPADQRLLAI